MGPGWGSFFTTLGLGRSPSLRGMLFCDNAAAPQQVTSTYPEKARGSRVQPKQQENPGFIPVCARKLRTVGTTINTDRILSSFPSHV